MSIVSTGQITLIDLTDSRPITFYLQSNQSKVQIKQTSNASGSTGQTSEFIPNYASSQLMITPYFTYGNDNNYSINNDQISYLCNGSNVPKVTINTIGTNKIYSLGGNLYVVRNIPDFDAEQLHIVATIPAGKIMDNTTGLSNPEIDATIDFSLITTGELGRGISRVVNYYKTSSSEQSTAPGKPSTNDPTEEGWIVNLSSVSLNSTTNKYLWCVQATYYKTGDGVEETSPEYGSVFLAGAFGDTGATITGIQEEYCVSSSSDKADGTWTQSAPTNLTQGNYLFVRTKISYSDGRVDYKPNQEGIYDPTWNIAASSMAALQQQAENLQQQIDGAIDTWYGTTDASDSPFTDDPSSSWTDDEKRKHNGDLYYNTSNGRVWRYVVQENENVITDSWIEIVDTALSQALEQIGQKTTIYYNNINDSANPVPSSANVGDLWFQYTQNNDDIGYGDQYKCTTTYSSGVGLENWTNYWEIANQTTSKLNIEYTYVDNSTDAPNDNSIWQDFPPDWMEGRYVWQRTVAYDRNNNVINRSPAICITNPTKSITSVINYYLASASSSGVTKPTDDNWPTDPSDSRAVISKEKRYLWNYEKTEYTYGDPTYSPPSIIGTYSEDGRGIERIDEWYQISDSGTTAPDFSITAADNETGYTVSSGWNNTLQDTTDEKPYLWNVEVVKYSSGTLFEERKPELIAYRGVSVSEVTTYFLTTNSEDPPSLPQGATSDTLDPGEWDTEFEPVSKGKQYLWSCVITILTDKTLKKSNPSMVTRYVENGKDTITVWVQSNGSNHFSDDLLDSITLTAKVLKGTQPITEGVQYNWGTYGGGNFSDGNEGQIPTDDASITLTRINVTNIATFYCNVTYIDDDNSSVTLTDGVVIYDNHDPISCEIASSNGTQFINGKTETILTAILSSPGKGRFSDADMAAYTFTWRQYNSNNEQVEDFTPEYNGSVGGYMQNGKKVCTNSIRITDRAVSTKGIFTVEVTETSST